MKQFEFELSRDEEVLLNDMMYDACCRCLDQARAYDLINDNERKNIFLSRSALFRKLYFKITKGKIPGG
jgi:hypothetical protein